MVAEGEDWKSVETPEAKGVAPVASNAEEESQESEQSTGGNSTVIIFFLSNCKYLDLLFLSAWN